MTQRAARKKLKFALDCPQCKREAEPGWIELDNNGPIVPCLLCNRNGDYRRDDR